MMFHIPLFWANVACAILWIVYAAVCGLYWTAIYFPFHILMAVLLHAQLQRRRRERARRPTDFLGQLVFDYGLHRVTDYGKTAIMSGEFVTTGYVLKVEFDGQSHTIEIDERELAIAYFPQQVIRQRVAQLVDEKRRAKA